MLFLLNIPAQIIKLFDSAVSPKEMAAGVCLALFMGLIPLNGPMALLLFIFFFVVRLNRLSTALVLPVLKLFYILGLWKVTDAIGGYLLIDAEYLNGFWRFVTNAPILALLDLNNTLVAGGLALSLILFAPVYFISYKFSVAFKEKYFKLIKESKFVKSLGKISFISKIVNFVNNIRSRVDVE